MSFGLSYIPHVPTEGLYDESEEITFAPRSRSLSSFCLQAGGFQTQRMTVEWGFDGLNHASLLCADTAPRYRGKNTGLVSVHFATFTAVILRGILGCSRIGIPIGCSPRMFNIQRNI